jgi:hypothetical protein
MVRDIAQFGADFPDDSIEGDEDERDFVRYPGLGVAECVAQMCRDMGFDVPAPESEIELGWVFDVHVGKRRYWFRLSDLGDHIILISSDMTRYEPTPGDIGHEELLRRIDTAMKADGRFSNVAWYTPEEYERVQGAPSQSSRRSAGSPLMRRAKRLAAPIIVLFVIGFCVACFAMFTPPSRPGDRQSELCRYAPAPGLCGLVLSALQK